MVLVPKSRASLAALLSVGIGLLSPNLNTDAFGGAVLLSRLQSIGDDAAACVVSII